MIRSPFTLTRRPARTRFFTALRLFGGSPAAIAMRLRVQSIKVSGGMIGAGVEEMRWTRPVRPNDSLRTHSEILHVRRSVNRPQYGIVRSRTTVYNQREEVVLQSVVNFLAPLRPEL